jgi:mannose-6-phosphate isomerase-like protein (cupin superfamily)
MIPDWPARVTAFRLAALACLTSAPVEDAAPGVIEECHQMAERLRRVSAPVAPPDPHALPAQRFLPEGLAAVAGAGPLRALADATAAVAPDLHWRNKYAQVDPWLFDRFAFCDLIGPDGAQASDEVTLGLVVLGPDTHYPLHHHPARELYLVIGGTAGWAVDDRPFADQAPGRLILHREMQPHAMKTGAQPLVALSLWRGDIRTPSRFSHPVS